jgi:lactate permease
MPTSRAVAASAALLVFALLILDRLEPDSRLIRSLLAAMPIVIVLILMTALRWGGQRAGPAGWAAGLLIAAAAFGLTFDVFWVSQAKGLLLSLFVLAVLWPALLLYHIIDQTGGIQAIAQALKHLIRDRGLLLIVVAWAFSGALEGLAGFGLPVAIVAPMLVGLDVSPVTAVAAVAVGHAWSVTFGDMGVIFQTLTGLVNVDNQELAATAALLLGIACLVCGLAAARLLKQGHRWPGVIVLAGLMGLTQYGIAVYGPTALAAFCAGLAGIGGGILLSQTVYARQATVAQPANPGELRAVLTPPLVGALLSYGVLSALLSAIALIGPLNETLRRLVWKTSFPEVTTLDGFVTQAGTGQVFRPLVHPGSAILLIGVVSYLLYRRATLAPPGGWRKAVHTTYRSAMPASIGVIAMVGLSTLMDHTGMTLLLAEGLSDLMEHAFPVVSPLVGILGAFATGSNNNSNVLFASLQENVALLLNITPTVLLAAQTTGGALGSMIAPAKIIVGCSTVGLKGQDGDVLRLTLPYGLAIGAGIGFVTLLLAL